MQMDKTNDQPELKLEFRKKREKGHTIPVQRAVH